MTIQLNLRLNFSTISWIFFGFVFGLLIIPGADAQTIQTEVLTDGKPNTFYFQPGSVAPRLRLAFFNGGNMTEAINFSVNAPIGATFSATSSPFFGSVAQTVANPATFTPMPLHGSDRKEKTSIRIDALPGLPGSLNNFVKVQPLSLSETAAAVSATSTPTTSSTSPASFNGTPCEGQSLETINSIVAALQQITRKKMTVAQFCAGSVSSGNGQTSANSNKKFFGSTRGVEAVGILRKNVCLPNNGSFYVGMIDIDLSTIDPAIIASGFEVTVSIGRGKYTGSLWAALKPKSEGRYAPNPIFLTAALGGLYGGGSEWLNVVRWNGHLVESVKRLKVEDYVSWKGQLLGRTVASSVLNGGLITVEATNGADVFGLCFKAIKTRQDLNNYGKKGKSR